MNDDECGIAPHIVEAVLNHATFRKGVAGVYNKASYQREIAAALNVWADHIHSLVEGDERKIVAQRQNHEITDRPLVNRCAHEYDRIIALHIEEALGRNRPHRPIEWVLARIQCSAGCEVSNKRFNGLLAPRTRIVYHPFRDVWR